MDWNATSSCHFWELCQVLGCICKESDNDLKWKEKEKNDGKNQQFKNNILSYKE